MTKWIIWLETRLDEGNWFRRGYVIVATALVWKFMLWGMEFAETSERPGTDVALILGALGVPIASVTGFAFSGYLGSRNENKS